MARFAHGNRIISNIHSTENVESEIKKGTSAVETTSRFGPIGERETGAFSKSDMAQEIPKR